MRYRVNFLTYIPYFNLDATPSKQIADQRIQVVQNNSFLDHEGDKKHDLPPPTTRFLKNILIEVSYGHDFFTDTKNKVKRTPQIP